jgi:FtsP/CotA-like multicopper oxidase with cupredoxin domain
MLTLGLIASVAVLVSAAQGTARPLTTEPTEIVDYNVALRDSGITVTPKVGLRGTAGRFIVRNFGKKPHTFTVGNDKVVVLHKAGLSTGLMRPKSRAKILLLFFDYRGQLAYRSIAPGDRTNPRMRGFFTID